MEEIYMGDYDRRGGKFTEIPLAIFSDYSGGPLEYVNYLDLKEKFGNTKGVYDIYGGYGTMGIGYIREEMSDEDFAELEEVLNALEDYPVIDEEHLSNYEWEKTEELMFAPDSDFRRVLLKNNIPDTDENLRELMMEGVLGYMGWASYDQLDYNDDTIKEAIDRADNLKATGTFKYRIDNYGHAELYNYEDDPITDDYDLSIEGASDEHFPTYGKDGELDGNDTSKTHPEGLIVSVDDAEAMGFMPADRWDAEKDKQMEFAYNESLASEKARLRESEKMDDTFDAGFAFSTSSEDSIKDVAEERGITLDWDKLNEDNRTIEWNFLRWLERETKGARDEGHGGYNGDELVGTIWLPAAQVPNFLYPSMQDNVDFDGDRLTIEFLNEFVDELREDLLNNCSDQADLLIESGRFTVWIDNPNDIYIDALTK
jgi:hypothetical protein